MRKFLRSAAAAVLLAGIVAGCARTTPREDSVVMQTGPDWVVVPSTLPAGFKTGFFDRVRHQPAVFALDRGSRDVSVSLIGDTTHVIKLGNAGDTYAGAGLTEDGTGVLWAAWGDRLARINPGDDSVRTWAVPSSPAQLPSDDVVPGAGRVVTATYDAIHDDVLVLKQADPTVYRFSVRQQGWTTGGTLPIFPGKFTKLSVAGDGTVVAQGTSSLKDFAPTLAFGRPDIGPMSTISNVVQYALAPAGDRIDVMDGKGNIITTSLPSLPNLKPAPGNTPSDTPLMIDSGGTTWTWGDTDGGTAIMRRTDVTTTGTGVATTGYAFPVVKIDPEQGSSMTLPLGASAPSAAQVYPQFESLVLGDDGTVFVMTGWDDKNGPYAAVYKLTA